VEEEIGEPSLGSMTKSRRVCKQEDITIRDRGGCVGHRAQTSLGGKKGVAHWAT